LDPTQLQVTVRHNGTIWEDFFSEDQIWDAATWIQELIKYITLHPGDVLRMGTRGPLAICYPGGHAKEVEISGIGVLRNYLVADE
jgi:2-keto-4-pentenoate hydratase/2-oxohepta-3-ene-1,7-dioic acid hydratase in catechol pathway